MAENTESLQAYLCRQAAAESLAMAEQARATAILQFEIAEQAYSKLAIEVGDTAMSYAEHKQSLAIILSNQAVMLSTLSALVDDRGK